MEGNGIVRIEGIRACAWAAGLISYVVTGQHMLAQPKRGGRMVVGFY